MDIEKMSNVLINRPDLADIPEILILRVACAMLEVINSGECFKELDSCI